MFIDQYLQVIYEYLTESSLETSTPHDFLTRKKKKKDEKGF